MKYVACPNCNGSGVVVAVKREDCKLSDSEPAPNFLPVLPDYEVAKLEGEEERRQKKKNEMYRKLYGG